MNRREALKIVVSLAEAHAADSLRPRAMAVEDTEAIGIVRKLIEETEGVEGLSPMRRSS
jgi:hypothetical protein